MSDAALEISELSVTLGDHRVLRDVSLSVPRGARVSVVGPNGAGKTTLLKSVMRIVEAQATSVHVCGRRLGHYTQRELAKVISYVPQSDGRLLPFTAGEFVRMGRYPHLSPFSALTAEDEDVVRRAMEQTGTTRYAMRSLATLSGGERQSVFIAAALAQGARLLLLDEPATFLDPRHQDEIYHLLARVNVESSVTILSVTHDVNAAALHSDRVVALKDGTVVFAGKPRELMTAETLSQIYDTRFTFVDHPDADLPMVVPSRGAS